jgi:predicted DNA-binding transcriptional regulator AlpA
MEGGLWDKATVAEFLGLGKRTVDRLTAGDQGFPQPSLIGPKGKKVRRWFSHEVIAWVKKQRPA